MSHEEDMPSSDQRPLKLVLKVGSTSTTVDRPVPSPRTLFNVPVEPIQEQAPKLTLAIDPISGEMTSSTSAKKLKKKKSKKKHRKHSHHHSHHHHHHHRHKSSCSHHSKSSSSIPSVLPPSTVPPLPIVSEPGPSIVSEPGPSTVPETPPVLEPAIVSMEVEESAEPVEETAPAPRSPSKTVSLKNMSRSSYHQFLTCILKQLQRRDSQEFFAWPVTDMIAPGYSTIIRQPMDLSSIKRKIDQRVYESVGEMKGDVKLMCENAMTYNLPETVYFKAARKLWHFAKEKVFSKEALADAQKMSLDPSRVDGSQVVPDLSTVGDTVSTDTSSQEAASPMETNLDLMDESEMTPDQILEQARRAAAGAAERLSLARPAGVHFSILRQREDGSTSLAIVGSHPGPERILRLEDLVGRLTDGLPYLQPYKEPDRNRVNPVETIDTPPFSSYLPSIDSCKANISREESSLLLSTYGEDELATEYAQSLLHFAGDSEYVLGMADSLLDVLTQGQHSKGLAQLKQLQTETPGEEKEGEEEEKEEEEGVEGGLEETAEIISKLHDVQKKRLSSTTKATNPGNEETTLAATLTSKLTALISTFAPPADVTDIKSIRKSMGIVLKGEA